MNFTVSCVVLSRNSVFLWRNCDTPPDVVTCIVCVIVCRLAVISIVFHGDSMIEFPDSRIFHCFVTSVVCVHSPTSIDAV